jgi:hypothetical protein
MLWTWLTACTLFAQRVPAECGDGVWAPFEACDPADPEYGAQCKEDCTWHICGDGVVAGVEGCDPPGPDCSSTCQPSTCGDGEVSDDPCWRLVPLTVEGTPLAPRFGDVDRDGDLDIVTPIAGSTAVAVVLNDGGSFGRTATVDVGVEATDVQVHPDGHLTAVGPSGYRLVAFDGLNHTVLAPPEPLDLTALDPSFPIQVAHDPDFTRLLLRTDRLVQASWRRNDDAVNIGNVPDNVFGTAPVQGYLDRDLVAISVDPDGLQADSAAVPQGPWPTPGPPTRIRQSPWTIDGERAFEWTTGDEVLHTGFRLRVVGRHPLGGADDGILFARTPDRPLQVAAIDGSGVHLFDGTTRQTVLDRPGVTGLDFADANGDRHLDLLTLDPGSGEILLILGDP